MTCATDGSGRGTPWHVVAGGAAVVAVVLVAENLGAGVLNRLLLHLPGVDKVLHFAQSLAIFLAMYWLLGARPRVSRVLLAAGIALGAAAFDELQQSVAGGRHIEFADIGAGLTGIVFGAGVVGPGSRRGRAALMAAAVAGAVALTARSYERTHDYNAGLLAESEGRYDDATRAYLRAAESGVENPDVYNAAAWALVQFGTGDPGRAVALAERSLQMRPGDPDTLDTYGWALYRAGRAADAAPVLQRAYQAKPDIYCIHYHLAMVFLALGRRDDGVRHLREQLASHPRVYESSLASAELARLGVAAGGIE